MNKTTVSMLGTLAAALLAACATHDNVARTEVNPVVSVRHGGSQGEGYYEMGRYYQAQGRTALAVDALRKVLAIDPGHAPAHNALGIALAAQGDHDAAVAEFLAAITASGGDPLYYNNLGYAYYLQGRPIEAGAALAKAAALDPLNVRVANNLLLARAGAPVRAPAASADAGGVTAPVAPARIVQAAPAQIVQAAPAQIVQAAPTQIVQAAPTQIVQVAPSVFELRVSDSPPPVPTSRGAAASTKTSAPVVVAAPVAVPVPPAPVVFGLEISNGNGVIGLARRMGVMLAAIGSPAARLTNQKPFAQGVTEVQYRAGHAASAAALRSRIPGSPGITTSSTLHPGIDVRLVLGRDLAGDVALLDPAGAGAQVAAATPRLAAQAR